MKIIYICVLYVVLAYAVFHPALRVGFLADDYIWLRAGLSTADLNLLDTHSFSFVKGRPGSLLVFALLVRSFGLNPTIFHVVVIMIHALNSVLLYLILRNLQVNPLLGFASSLLFLIHFSHEEAIFWIAALSTVFCLFFSLVAVLLYCRLPARKSTPMTLAIIGALCAAVLTREEGVVVPLVILLIGFSRLVASKGVFSKSFQAVKENALYFVPAFVYLCYRLVTIVNSPISYEFTLNPVIWAKNLIYLVVNQLIPSRLVFDLVGYDRQLIVRNWIATVTTSLSVIAGTIGFLLFFLYLTAKSWSKIPVYAKVSGSLAMVGFVPYLALNGSGQRFLYFSLVGGAMMLAFVTQEVAKSIYRQQNGLVYLWILIFLGVSSTAIIQVRSKSWIGASRMVHDILKQTANLAQTAPPDKNIYLTDLPARLNGAYVFHQGLEEAIYLYLPEYAGRIHHVREPIPPTDMQEKGLWFKWADGQFLRLAGLANSQAPIASLPPSRDISYYR